MLPDCGPEDEIRRTEELDAQQNELDSFYEEDRDRDADYSTQYEVEEEECPPLDPAPEDMYPKLPDTPYYQAIPDNHVSFPEGFNPTGILMDESQFQHNCAVAGNFSFAGMVKKADGSVEYKDTIITNLKDPEPAEAPESMVQKAKKFLLHPVESLRKLFGNAPEPQDFAYQYEYLSGISAAAITGKIEKRGYTPPKAASPAETAGYEVTVLRLSDGHGASYDDYAGVLIFPKTRMEAEVLHASAVEFFKTGASPSEVIKHIVAEAEKRGIPARIHPDEYYGVSI